jgi:uncharacterized membrane protein
MEGFSDGVLAIVITIMVLELRVPQGETPAALSPLVPAFLAYVLSFIYLGIYWNNHHHLLRTVKHVTGGIMWANLHLLFWLSLFPVVTAWVGVEPKASWPAAFYGAVLLGAALAWLILERAIIRGGGSLAQAIGKGWKERISAGMYVVGISLAFVHPWLADAVFASVAAAWVIPDRRIARGLSVKP